MATMTVAELRGYWDASLPPALLQPAPPAPEPEPEPEPEEPQVLQSQRLEDLTVAELRDLAAAGGVDLGGATRKADIIAAIETADVDTLDGDE